MRVRVCVRVHTVSRPDARESRRVRLRASYWGPRCKQCARTAAATTATAVAAAAAADRTASCAHDRCKGRAPSGPAAGRPSARAPRSNTAITAWKPFRARTLTHRTVAALRHRVSAAYTLDRRRRRHTAFRVKTRADLSGKPNL